MWTRNLAAAAMLLGSSAFGIVGLQAQSAQPVLPQPGDTGEDTLVQSRGADQSARERVITAKGGGGKLVAMRAIVRNHFRAPGRNSVKITNSEQLASQDAEEVALFLTMLGYDPVALQQNGPNAASIVKSASSILFGRSTISDEMAVSREVVVARLTKVAASRLGDGYGSTASFEITRVIKGTLETGSSLLLRQRSGPTSDGEVLLIEDEFQPGMSGDFLLFVSPEMYKFRSKQTADEARSYVTAFLLPYEAIGGRAYATGDGQQSTGFAIDSLTP